MHRLLRAGELVGGDHAGHDAPPVGVPAFLEVGRQHPRGHDGRLTATPASIGVPPAIAGWGPFEQTISSRPLSYSIGVSSSLPSQTLASPRPSASASPASGSPSPSPSRHPPSRPRLRAVTSAARRPPGRARRWPSGSPWPPTPRSRARVGPGRWSSCRPGSWPPRCTTSWATSSGPTASASCAIFGGIGYRDQVRALHKGVNIVVACPGRLEDLIERGDVRLDDVTTVVLDEADRMSDMGFLPAVRRLLGPDGPEPPGAPLLGHHRA